jgi:hypothetical protein
MDYGHGELSTSDTPVFLAATESQSVTGILPLFSSLALEWFLIGMEKKLSFTEHASLVWVLDQPSHPFKSPEHAAFIEELHLNGKKLLAVHKDLVESACMHRRKLITEALEKGNKISTYICANCFERYMTGWERYRGTGFEGKYRLFLREHLEALTHYIERYPDRYQLRLLTKCPRTRYELLYLPMQSISGEPGSTIDKAFFLGHEPRCIVDRKLIGTGNDCGFGQGFGDMIGFATDLQSILDFFHKQHAGLTEHFIDHRFEDPAEMIDHIRRLVEKNIPA